MPPEQREQALARECGGDERLREKLERLLRAAERRSELFEPATGGASSESATFDGRAAPRAGDSIGPWRLVRSLGAGGMGEVWLVERQGADFRQRAALKLVKRGMDTDEVLARFRPERKVLAQLAHPAIPSLIDGGASDDGRPYVVMELVEGAPLDAFLRERALDLPARLRLFLRIGEAVQHAHERGVVHRDLKPSNVLVTSAGEPKLLDFGISKVLEGGDEAHTLDLTLTGQQMLTPRYASPEQVQGREITAATDVYALGLILWELLVGKPAVSFDGLTQADFAESARFQSAFAGSTVDAVITLENVDRPWAPAGEYVRIRVNDIQTADLTHREVLGSWLMNESVTFTGATIEWNADFGGSATFTSAVGAWSSVASQNVPLRYGVERTSSTQPPAAGVDIARQAHYARPSVGIPASGPPQRTFEVEKPMSRDTAAMLSLAEDLVMGAPTSIAELRVELSNQPFSAETINYRLLGAIELTGWRLETRGLVIYEVLEFEQVGGLGGGTGTITVNGVATNL